MSFTPYDSAAPPQTMDDTTKIVWDDNASVADSVTRLADEHGARVDRDVARQDDVHINGHTYRGVIARWAWEIPREHRKGCDAAFVGTSYSCFQQSYATPRGVLRVTAQLKLGLAVIELAAFSNEVLAAITSQP